MRIHGFKQLISGDKFSGPEKEIFIASITSLLEDTAVGCNDDPQEYPLYSLLSPHHRLSLLADVAIGLLVHNFPPPPDTLEHFSAFYVIYSYALVQIEVEIDTEQMDKTEHNINKQKIPINIYENFDERLSDMTEKGALYSVKSFQHKKQIKKAIKSISSEVLSENINSETLYDKKLLKNSLSRMADLELNGPEGEKEINANHEEFYYYWRKLMYNFVFENREKDKFLKFPFLYTSINYKEDWLFQLRRKMGAVGINMPKTDFNLMFGSIHSSTISLDDENDLKRYAQVSNLVNEKTTEYENSWTVEKTLLASRIIRVFDVNCNLTKKENAIAVINSCKRNYNEMKELFNSNTKLNSKFHSFAKNLWIADWHEVMIQKNKSYDSLTDRIIAVQSIQRNSTFSIIPYLDKMPGIVELNQFESPHDWRASQDKEETELTCCNIKCAKSLHKKEMKFCECKKVVYCCKECQIVHWKNKHKKNCESRNKDEA